MTDTFCSVQSDKTNEIFTYIRKQFGEEPKCELEYSNAHELLIAIVLSAQCTDARVNKVTRLLFAKYKTITDFAKADIAELERDLSSINFFRNKARSVKELCLGIERDFGGVVPRSLEALESLRGVGRKTANVFLAEFYKIPRIGVDTHVSRVSRRLGLTKNSEPRKIEVDLASQWDKQNYCNYHLYLVLFGRYICTARNPKCEQCELGRYCSMSAIK